MKKVITAEMFESATGYPPKNDDLERCNCAMAGQVLHRSCGWNDESNLPVFIAGPSIAKPAPDDSRGTTES